MLSLQKSKSFNSGECALPRFGQIKTGSRMGMYSYKPNWRDDASGAGHVVTFQEMYAFNRKALDLLIAWSDHNENTLGDLVKYIQNIPEEDRINVWNLVDQ
ncbi:hypothetical protein [Paenibacillus sp. 481]|uniref:hypothetical protein n=1 Tax=Paenibacillus sp. 481 TaxID=2835869 RepID=UPI001E37E411|nr:hypothetical protein [Paenibacillus sp. 481]UHA73289.1 hypothetical protein KIK04_22375 [Paenibacillus sp. 481]